MPKPGKNNAQRKGTKNLPSPSINRTELAADKAQETKQRSQSIVQKLSNSANKDSSDPLVEDDEVEQDAEDHVGSPTNLSSAFDMATPNKLDQQEKGVGSEHSESDARALSPSPTHTDREHPPSPTRDTSEEQQDEQQEQAQGLHV